MAGRLNRLLWLRPGRARLAAWLALVIAVVAIHDQAMRWVAERVAEFTLGNPMPVRIEVAYVREMVLAEPPAAAPKPPPPAPRKKKRAPAAAPPEPAASAPVDVAVAEATPAREAASAPAAGQREESTESAAHAASAASAAVAAAAAVEPPAAIAPPADTASAPTPTPTPAQTAAAAASAVPGPLEVFDWPASTRMSYVLTGYYRGDVEGSAQVEWIRAGTRYQVHLDIVIGPSMAPLITRRMSSDGEITPEGLSPRRYDEDTKAVFRDRRHVTMLFERDVVIMPSGERRERWPGVQDSASQFVQLTFMFTLNPALLSVGNRIDVPLALPKNIDRWTYEVMKEETLYTPFGAVASFHVKPRRVTRPGGELSAEVWFAPRLRYLPARIRIQQDAETYLDMVLDRRPEIAAQ